MTGRRHRQREIARRLRAVPAGEPPADLLARLREDVPAELGERLDAERDEPAPPPARTLRWVPAAAALAMVVGGGLLVWRVFEGVPLVEESPEPAVVREAAAGGEGRAVGETAEAAGESGEAAGEGGAELHRLGYAGGAGPSRRSENAPPRGALSQSAEDERIAVVAEEADTGAVTGFREEATVAGKSPTIAPTATTVGASVDETVDEAASAEAARRPRPAAPEPPPADAAIQAAVPEPAPSAPSEAQRADRAAAARQPAPWPKRVPLPAPAPAPAESRQAAEAVRVRYPGVHPFVDTAADRLSTFGLDVDTGSYAVVRALLARGQLPPPATVRLEEIVNYFVPGDPAPPPGETFGLVAEGGPSPFRDDTRYRLLRFGVRARDGADTVAEEARVQVEIEPRSVVRWRLLGYENRAIADERFRYESEDAGEIGPGHSVTALYEVELAEPAARGTLALLELRWRDPETGRFREVERRLDASDVAPTWEAASPAFRLAATAAAFAEALRGSPWAGPELLGETARRAERLAAEAGGRPEADELARLSRRVEELRSDDPR